MKEKNLKKSICEYIPLIAIEIYLAFSILLLFFGPVKWTYDNRSKLLILLLLYHLSFIFGYIYVIKNNKSSDKKIIVL